MKVVQKLIEDKEDYRDQLEIEIDGETKFSIGRGEPEDMYLSRDLNDAYRVVDLMTLAYEAGKNGEEFEVSKVKLDYKEYYS